MVRSVLCLLTVALAFVPLLSAVEGHSEKPGVCPKPRTDINLAVVSCLNQCSSDSECKGNLKCCFDGCGHVCEEPRDNPKPKKGSCPSPSGFGICVNACSSDEECKGDDKCCSNGCGKTCQPPVTNEPKPKKGSCPSPSGFGTCVNACSSDEECKGDDKCCSNGCGHTCQPPVTMHSDKPGVCPKPRTDIDLTLVKCAKLCSTDSECEGNLKCCFNGCGYGCVNPRGGPKPKTKPGLCPRNYPEICATTCYADEDCKEDDKCCTTGCGQICQRPVTNKPKPKKGSCPSPSGFGTCVNACSSDEECKGDDKCCSNGCGHTCQPPVTMHSDKPGVCPKPRTDIDLTVVRCGKFCSTDSECEGKLKCCFDGCGYGCTKPRGGPKPKTKPGLCPRNYPEICATTCYADEDCKEDDKCCTTGCGQICQRPVINEPKPKKDHVLVQVVLGSVSMRAPLTRL
ncbi:hypothetical protein NQD34_018422 [Periophthalmus magnuspinnatus]|nr:hypothetical protein NQD34_018422 [Periophthalmus magnuspinnatus]